MEIWKDVPGYEDRYKISNFGVLKTKSYIKELSPNRKLLIKERILKPTKNIHGYFFKKLSKNNKGKIFKIHQIMAMAFLNFKPCSHNLYVDHIDRNKENNKLENLRILTPYESISNREIYKTSKYQGVSFDKKRGKWVARININGVYKFLGRFDDEETAYNVIKNRTGKTVGGTFIKD